MITVKLQMKLDQSPLKRVPVAHCLDADGHCTAPVFTDRGSSAALHRLFPRGGPQKQGNRLAGLLRTKGEH
jgi:tRNA 2-thiouridine synthesizing protein E